MNYNCGIVHDIKTGWVSLTKFTQILKTQRTKLKKTDL